MNEEQQKQLDKLARDVLILSRNTLLVNLRFLDSALSQFKLVSYDGSLATEGRHICYNTIEILKRYKNEKEVSVRDYLHLVMHCIFRHMFMNPSIDRPCWDLACDIAVEYSITELGLKSATAKREMLQQKVYSELKQEIKILTAEKIYRYYLDKGLSPLEMAQLRGFFYADDHFLWYETAEVIAMFAPWMLAAIDDAGYNGIRDEHLDRVADEIYKTGLSEIDRDTFEHACRQAGVETELFDEESIERLKNKLR